MYLRRRDPRPSRVRLLLLQWIDFEWNAILRLRRPFCGTSSVRPNLWEMIPDSRWWRSLGCRTGLEVEDSVALAHCHSTGIAR